MKKIRQGIRNISVTDSLLVLAGLWLVHFGIHTCAVIAKGVMAETIDPASIQFINQIPIVRDIAAMISPVFHWFVGAILFGAVQLHGVLRKEYD